MATTPPPKKKMCRVNARIYEHQREFLEAKAEEKKPFPDSEPEISAIVRMAIDLLIEKEGWKPRKKK